MRAGENRDKKQNSKLSQMSNEASYHKLIVYQKTKQLVLLIYKITKNWPREEQFGLTSQIRRSIISVLSNIVEGYIRSSSKEFIRFLDIAIGSLAECEVQLELGYDLRYIVSETDYNNCVVLLTEVNKLLYSFRAGVGDRAREQESERVKDNNN